MSGLALVAYLDIAMHATPAVDVLQSTEQLLDQAGHDQLWDTLWRHQQQPSAQGWGHQCQAKGADHTNGNANLNLQDKLAR